MNPARVITRLLIYHLAFFVLITALGFVAGGWADTVVKYMTIGFAIAIPALIFLAWPTLTSGVTILGPRIPRGVGPVVASVLWTLALPYGLAITYGFLVYWLPTHKDPMALVVIGVMYFGVVILSHAGIVGGIFRLGFACVVGYMLLNMVNLRNDVVGPVGDTVRSNVSGDSSEALKAEREAHESAAAAQRAADRLETQTLDEADAKRLSDWTKREEARLKPWKDGGYVGPMPTPDPADPRPTPLPRPGKPTASEAPATVEPARYFDNRDADSPVKCLKENGPVVSAVFYSEHRGKDCTVTFHRIGGKATLYFADGEVLSYPIRWDEDTQAWKGGDDDGYWFYVHTAPAGTASVCP